MKLKSVETSNNVLAILLFLNTKEYIASSVIREKFRYLNENTLRAWLKNWVKAGILDKLELIPDTAGGDKAKFKLTLIGLKKREELVEIFLMTLNNRIKHKIKNHLIESEISNRDEYKSERINNFIMEISEEFAGIIEDNTLSGIQKQLQKMLDEYF